MMKTMWDHRVYADGETMFVNWREGVLRVDRPLVTNFSIEMPTEDCYSRGSQFRHVVQSGPTELRGEFIAYNPEFINGATVPDLSNIAEKLTVRELLRVIEKKLDRRAEQHQ